MQKLSDRELCMRATQIHENRKNKHDPGVIYGLQGSFFDNTEPKRKRENGTCYSNNIRVYLPEPVKIGKFNCIKFIGGQIQLVYKNSVRNVQFGKRDDGILVARLANGQILG